MEKEKKTRKRIKTIRIGEFYGGVCYVDIWEDEDENEKYPYFDFYEKCKFKFCGKLYLEFDKDFAKKIGLKKTLYFFE